MKYTKYTNKGIRFLKPNFKSLSIVAALIVTSTANAFIGPGDWSEVRLYGHSRNNNGYSNSEYNFIRDHFFLHTIEKAHARKIFGEGKTEVAAREAADEIVKRSPAARPLFYWNSTRAYTTFYSNMISRFKAAPSNFQKSAQSPSGYIFTFPNQGARNWWNNVATNVVNSARLRGVFIDATLPHDDDGPDLARFQNMLDKLPGLVIYNGYWPNGPHSNPFIDGGGEVLNHADGVFVESFFHKATSSRNKAELLLDCLLYTSDAADE